MSEIDSELRALRRQTRDLERRIEAARRPLSDAEVAALETLQARADSVAVKFGERGPAPRAGEQPHEYRIRILEGLQRFSPTFADFNLGRADSALVGLAEAQILEAAERAAHAGTETKAPLVKVEEKNDAGQTITTYYGDPLEWMRPFMSGGQVCRVTRPGFEE